MLLGVDAGVLFSVYIHDIYIYIYTMVNRKRTWLKGPWVSSMLYKGVRHFSCPAHQSKKVNFCAKSLMPTKSTKKTTQSQNLNVLPKTNTCVGKFWQHKEDSHKGGLFGFECIHLLLLQLCVNRITFDPLS